MPRYQATWLLLCYYHYPCSEEEDDNVDTEDDKARILITSITEKDNEDAPVIANPVMTFENPVYGTTGPRSSTGSFSDSVLSPEVEITKEDLSIIGKPLFEDDIDL